MTVFWPVIPQLKEYIPDVDFSKAAIDTTLTANVQNILHGQRLREYIEEMQ